MSKSIKKSKAGRKPIHAQKITEEDFQNLEEGITTRTEVAQQKQIPVGAVDNALHTKRSKLKLTFENKKADPNLSNAQNLKEQASIEEIQQSNLAQNQIPLDATEQLKGMWQFMDTVLQMTNMLTKGQIEYSKLSDEELNRLATVSNGSTFMRKVATQEGLSGLIIVGTIVGTFGSHIKFNFKKKAKKETEEIVEEEAVKNAEIKNSQINNSVVPEENYIFKSKYEATPEYQLPTDESNPEVRE